MVDARARDSGVTLLEVLVVLALIATTAGVVTLALPKGASERSVVQEAELLLARLNLAAERSLIEGQSFRMEWTTAAYAFSELSDGAWHASSANELPAEHSFPAAFTLSDASGTRTGDIVITPDLLPPKEGLLELSITAETIRRSILFDGVRARPNGDQ